MDVTGGNKGFWLIAAYQFAEFIKGHIGVVNGVGGKQGTGKCIAGS